MGDTVVRPANHRDPFHLLLRANRTLLLALMWAALAACVAGSLAFDIAGWLSAWLEVSCDALTSGAPV